MSLLFVKQFIDFCDWDPWELINVNEFVSQGKAQLPSCERQLWQENKWEPKDPRFATGNKVESLEQG